MKSLKYEIEIKASVQATWDTMLDPESYKKWAKAFSPNSQFSGEWKEGACMNFFDPDMGGTKARIEVFIPHKEILAKHVGLLDKDQNEDDASEFAEKWIGTTESYTFTGDERSTKLSIAMETDEAFANMFEEGWPKALMLLKELCES